MSRGGSKAAAEREGLNHKDKEAGAELPHSSQAL
jgi:hypothetical protein